MGPANFSAAVFNNVVGCCRFIIDIVPITIMNTIALTKGSWNFQKRGSESRGQVVGAKASYHGALGRSQGVGGRWWVLGGGGGRNSEGIATECSGFR